MATTSTAEPVEARASAPPGGGAPRAWLLPTTRPASAWIETVVITLIALAAGWLADPADPLGVKGSFLWLWFAPVLVALRYGVVPGIVSAALLIAGWYAWTIYGTGSADAPIPKLQFLGGLLLTLVCAEYGAAWRGRVRRAEEMSGYLDERLERVTRRLFLLRLSHERLEQELLSQPTTLRDALAQLRTRVLASLRDPLARDPAGGNAMPGAQALLAFLAQHCQLESAALHAAEGAPGQQAFRMVARIGTPPELAPNDPLLAYVLDNGTLGHVQTERPEMPVPTPHLVIAPVQASEGTLLGVLTVGRMPFFALNQDTLQLVAVLLGAYADVVRSGPQLARIAATLPGAPEEFTEELARLLRIQRDLRVASHIVLLVFGEHEHALDAHRLVQRSRRAPDVAWVAPPAPGARAAFANILPISGPAAVEGYLVRTENALRETFGGGFDALAVRTFVIALAEPDPPAALAEQLGLAPAGAPR